MQQLPADKRRQYRELGLPAADVLVLADELPTAQYFDAVLAAGAPPKPAANWVMGDLTAFCKASVGVGASGAMRAWMRRLSVPHSTSCLPTQPQSRWLEHFLQIASRGCVWAPG